MEPILREAVSKHMEGREVNRDSQHGFIKGKLCQSNLMEFYDGVTALLDKERETHFCKAFDTEPHTSLSLN